MKKQNSRVGARELLPSSADGVQAEYAAWIVELKQRYLASCVRAAVHVNSEVLRFYWSIGADIVNRGIEARYGERFFERLSRDLRKAFDDAKGFSVTNLRYMRKFFLFYSGGAPIPPRLGEKLREAAFRTPWGHQKMILDKAHDVSEALFYMDTTLRNGYSRNSLAMVMQAGLYRTKGGAVSNFSRRLPPGESDLAQEMTKDPYNFGFLRLPVPYKERELEDGLVRHIVEFLLELGTGFAFLGRQYRLVTGKDEIFIDLLFYNTRIRSYVVVELKTTEFQPEHLGQLGYYVSVVNHHLRGKFDNPTVGLLICRTKDNVRARYALESMSQPIGISGYELTPRADAETRAVLPPPAAIERELTQIVTPPVSARKYRHKGKGKESSHA